MYILKLPWLNHTEENRKNEVYTLSVSPDGERLASGGLDGKVRIWSIPELLKFKDSKLPRNEFCKPLCAMTRHTGAVTVVKFSPDEQNLEHWSVTKRVVAHDNDIQDIAWAPDSSILVSVGLDRSIIIWNGNTFERIKRFDVHQSTVKGVVFDPANKYFATSSDDRSVRVFRYHKGSELSFSIEKTILKPFKRSPLTTYFRRLSWSPDGQFIAAPNATNGPVTSVAIINRGSWVSDISLIGHDSPCEVAAFSPVLYEIQKDGETTLSTVLATAGHDRSLVIWNNMLAKPVAVFEEIHYKAITDLCWGPLGKVLFISSLDGTISVIEFEDKELGVPVSSAKNDELLNKYGVDKDSMVFPESSNQLLLEDKAKEYLKTQSERHLDALMRLEQPRSGDSPKQPPAPKVNSPRTVNSPKTRLPLQPQDAKLNKVVIKNGKKRVAPTLISTSSHTSKNTLDKFSNITVTTKKQKLDPKKSQLSSSAYDLPRQGILTAVHGYHVKKTTIEEEEDEDSNDEIQEFLIEDLDDEDLVYKMKDARPNHSNILRLQPSYSPTRLLTKLLRNGQTQSQTLEILNYENVDDDEPTTIRCYENGEIVFEQFTNDQCIAITGVWGKYWVIATNNGSLLVYSPQGRLLYPKIELGFNVDFFKAQGDILLVLTEDYMIHTYDLCKFKKLNKKVSLANIVNAGCNITGFKKVSISYQILDIEIKNDSIVVYLPNNEVYVFDSDLQVWVKVLDGYYKDYYQNYNDLWVDKVLTLKQKSAPKHNKDEVIVIDDDHDGEDEIQQVNVEEEQESEEAAMNEYVKKLNFAESYETVLDRYFKVNNDENGKVLQELKASPLYKISRED
ncbi:hypothetical protein WICPIJ_003516 [Wickerhamomyces pijperi]|uniref:Protein HIR n=1 Tax=Wickerhamomyces pijperi TaxID=599730 RepID=A0A9P8Q9H5_WICPI|nr:hypothetical protein WICPIJ_003516 [Wickerhamomyces pijperi]